MSNTNIFIVTGDLGGHPEGKEIGNSFVCNFSIAVSEYRKEDKPMWVRVAAWTFNVTCNKYMNKSHKVFAEGSLVHDLKTSGVKVFVGEDNSAEVAFKMAENTVQLLAISAEQPFLNQIQQR